MRPAMILLAALAVFAVTGSAAVINVPGDYPTIQLAIDAAMGGDTVMVGPGTYIENIRLVQQNSTLDGSWRTVQLRRCNTQISVNRRRAVLKSTTILSFSRSRSISEPSSCKPRRPMSSASMRDGAACLMASK